MIAWSSGVSGRRPAQPPEIRARSSSGTRWIAFVTVSSIRLLSIGTLKSSPMSSTSPGLNSTCSISLRK